MEAKFYVEKTSERPNAVLFEGEAYLQNADSISVLPTVEPAFYAVAHYGEVALEVAKRRQVLTPDRFFNDQRYVDISVTQLKEGKIENLFFKHINQRFFNRIKNPFYKRMIKKALREADLTATSRSLEQKAKALDYLSLR